MVALEYIQCLLVKAGSVEHLSLTEKVRFLIVATGDPSCASPTCSVSIAAAMYAIQQDCDWRWDGDGDDGSNFEM